MPRFRPSRRALGEYERGGRWSSLFPVHRHGLDKGRRRAAGDPQLEFQSDNLFELLCSNCVFSPQRAVPPAGSVDANLDGLLCRVCDYIGEGGNHDCTLRRRRRLVRSAGNNWTSQAVRRSMCIARPFRSRMSLRPTAVSPQELTPGTALSSGKHGTAPWSCGVTNLPFGRQRGTGATSSTKSGALVINAATLRGSSVGLHLRLQHHQLDDGSAGLSS